MTKNKDFKRLVRARMAKTGESYAAARLQLRGEGPGQAPAVPDESEYADLAGMSHEAVKAKTGKDWVEWVSALDEAQAPTLTHTEIARLVREKWPEIGGWWAQSVTGGYERIRGLRLKGQNRETGKFDANKSKTFEVSAERLYHAFADGAQREQWCDLVLDTRTCAPLRSVRMVTAGGEPVNAYVTEKGPEKATVSIQHRQLALREDIATAKAQWTRLFASLEGWLNT